MSVWRGKLALKSPVLAQAPGRVFNSLDHVSDFLAAGLGRLHHENKVVRRRGSPWARANGGPNTQSML